ncbi:diguanylate cyclase [Mongoliimonas terrestris]|uniref:diguanylate cyclase n=1 Tax=Mongoliimonas terrestris TaxID=1709001 RepID=UPI0009F970BD|nr:diguanylate cyclase [Mongoliimonas terrestris]
MTPAMETDTTVPPSVAVMDRLDASSDGRPALCLRSLLDQASAEEDLDNVPESIRLSELGVMLARKADKADLVIDFYATLARGHACSNDWPTLVTRCEEGLDWLPRATNPAASIRLIGMLALAYASLNRADRAVGLIRQMKSLPLELSADAHYILATKVGEIHFTLGRYAATIEDYRRAIVILDSLDPEAQSPFRIAFVRIYYANAILTAASTDTSDSGTCSVEDLDQVLQRIAEAAVVIDDVPLLRNDLTIARGHCLALLGEPDPALKSSVLALANKDVTALSWSLESVFAWAVIEATRGDVAFARALLAKCEPETLPASATALVSGWYHAMGDVLTAAGDHAGAAAAYRTSIVEDRRHRDRQTALVFEMAERASRVDEVAERARETEDRADHLARTNASLAAEREQLARSAYEDPLTGLGNRRLLEHRIATLRADPRLQTYAIAIGDVDHFKSVNDRFSHQIGDKVLAVVGGILARSVRNGDLAVRWGGEEFVILFNARIGTRRLEAVRRAVEAWDWSTVAPGLAVTISFGIAPWPTSDPFDKALALADQRLYAAKAAGRNRVVAA